MRQMDLKGSKEKPYAFTDRAQAACEFACAAALLKHVDFSKGEGLALQKGVITHTLMCYSYLQNVVLHNHYNFCNKPGAEAAWHELDDMMYDLNVQVVPLVKGSDYYGAWDGLNGLKIPYSQILAALKQLAQISTYCTEYGLEEFSTEGLPESAW